MRQAHIGPERAKLGAWSLIALLGGIAALAPPAAADVGASGEKFGGIVVDGLAGDWAGVPGTTLTIIRPLATTERMVDGLTLKVAYDDANIYVLLMINDDYDYNATNHDASAAIAVLWQIDPLATPDMGGGNGNVDVWHWELDCGPGVLSGYYLGSGNDPDCNLDDEWASGPTDRHDDNLTNELYGAWSHTNMTAAGSPGQWIFEMRRSLVTLDTFGQDRQFHVGETAGMAAAFWDPDESPAGWTPQSHFATCKDPATLDFSWVDVNLVPVTEVATRAQLDALNASLAAANAEIDHIVAEARGTSDALANTTLLLEQSAALLAQTTARLNDTAARATAANNTATAALGSSTTNGEDIEGLHTDVVNVDAKAASAGTLPLIIGAAGLAAGLAGVGLALASRPKKAVEAPK